MRNGVKMLLATCGALAIAGCETVAEEVTEAIGFEYTAMLAPVSGSGSGKVEVSLNDATNQICGDVETDGLADITSASIRLGPGGAVVTRLDTPDDDDSDDCDDAPDGLIDSIKANPGAYYAEVVATNGTLRGQLRKER